jgi:hypothetical protein
LVPATAVMTAVFVVQMSQADSLGLHILTGLLVAVGCVGVVRAWLMGTITVDDRQVWVRSFYRSRHLLRSEVEHFEAATAIGGYGQRGRTLRVVPLTGKPFRVGELFDRVRPGGTSSVEELAATLNRTIT